MLRVAASLLVVAPGANEWMRWLKRAAELGHPVAQYELAREFMLATNPARSSIVNPPDKAEVVQLLRNSACAGFPPALEALRAGNQPFDASSCPPPALDLDGAWEGKLAIIGRHRDDGPTQQPVETRIEVGANAIRVDVHARSGWTTAMTGKFQIRRLGSTAVLHAIHDGWDNDGRFVESWVFTLTAVDHDHLRVVYQRVVNNNHLPRDHREAVWWYAAAGDLVRASAGGTATVTP